LHSTSHDFTKLTVFDIGNRLAHELCHREATSLFTTEHLQFLNFSDNNKHLFYKPTESL